MSGNQIVVRFMSGKTLKGHTNDFFPNKCSFHLDQLNGEIVEISVDELKAIFFVKDYEGDKNHIKEYEDIITGGGRLMTVKFNDGETITGYTQGYSPARQGFFLIPADLKDNNERIYVVKSSTVSVQYCSLQSAGMQQR